MSDLAGQTALVTGGTRGIGRQIALNLAQAGARVLLTSRTDGAAAETASEISAQGHDAHGLGMDVADDAAVKNGVRSLVGDYGTISILVNNAGITRDSLLLRMSKEQWDFVVETNLGGIYRLCRAVVPLMVRARYGRIINITSVVAQSGNPGQVNYAASCLQCVDSYLRRLGMR